MKPDIVSRKDIEALILGFYERVLTDEMIGFIFKDIVKVDWEAHLPVMYDFWESTLFYNSLYKGNAIAKHKELNRLISLTPAHFERWLKLFTTNVDDHFEGINANTIKTRALSIATVMQIKLHDPLNIA